MPLNSPAHTSDELSGMTIAQLKELADNEGYTITATRKAGIISEILEQDA